jgi:virginiamycin B lyase
MEFQIPTADSQPTGIAVGADGNLWFTESGSGKIGRIPPGGQVNEFPSGSGQPIAIALGSDGNLWFAQSLSTSLGRITPAGVVDTVLVFAESTAIAAGPDGNVWFAGAANQPVVARVTPAGLELPYFQLPFSVSGIAAGPDGNVWFAESQGIAHVSP